MSSVWTVLETLDAADDDDGVSELNSCQRPHVLFGLTYNVLPV